MTDKPDLGTPELHRRMRVENSGDGSRLRARVLNQRTIDALFYRAVPAITERQHWAAERWWQDFERGGFWLYAHLKWGDERGNPLGNAEKQMEYRDRYLKAGAAIQGFDHQLAARHVVCFGDTIGAVRRIIHKRHMAVLDMLRDALNDLDNFYS